MITPFQAMQAALDIAKDSPHPTNKIAASIFAKNILVAHTNHWPSVIVEKIGIETKIGNSSGTIHAETACLTDLKEPAEGSSICITDPFCPNCAKNIAEAGIKNIYIDETGFEKDFFKRRSGDFDKMSMRIVERAGINVFALNMVTKKQRPILEIDESYQPIEDSPIEYIQITKADEDNFTKVISAAEDEHQRRKFSIAFVKTLEGKNVALIARAHAVIGYSLQKREEALELLTPIGKYSFIQEPTNRLMMHIARKGHELINGYLYCSQVPTSREQVNLVGAGIKRITIGNAQKCRDPYGIEAMKLLRDKKILDFS